MCFLKQLSSQTYDQIAHIKMSSHLSKLAYDAYRPCPHVSQV